MTGVAEVLRDHGYVTRAVGKWDVGMATEHHSPVARGYDSWFGYWHHSNDYWSQNEESCGGVPVKDLWRQNATFNSPATERQNGPSCSQDNQFPEGEVCVYEEDLFFREVRDIISSHDTEMPLFLFYSMHLVHMPLQVSTSDVKFCDFGNHIYLRSPRQR
jgi:arylsulfatase B